MNEKGTSRSEGCFNVVGLGIATMLIAIVFLIIFGVMVRACYWSIEVIP